jgi:hypothetical protein
LRIALATTDELPRLDTDLPILIEAFARRGVHAHCVAWDDPSIDWRSFGAVVVRSTWNYIQHFDAYVAWIDRVSQCTRLLNSRETLLWNLHKRYLLELASAGIAVVPTELVEAGRHPDWLALHRGYDEIVVKPAVSAGSFATVRLHRAQIDHARAHRDEHLSRDMLVQPLVSSVVTNGESNLVYFGGQFSHAVRKGARWDGDREQSRGLVQPLDDERALANKILGVVAARGFGTPPYARVDLARDDAGRPVLMELELVEPSLFLDRAPEHGDRLVHAVLDAL